MRTVKLEAVGKELAELISESNPVDEDIGILDKEGNVLGVVITGEAYNFFLEKIEEEEDRIDIETVKDFHQSEGKNQ